MIEKLANKILKKIQDKNPNMTEIQRDRIWFGLMILLDEVPKTIILCLITWYLGILKQTLIAFAAIAIYRTFSGGVHLKSFAACFIVSSTIFIGIPIISKYIIWDSEILKYSIFLAIWIYNMAMITLYAPGDTEAVPIINKKQRKNQKILSYIMMNLVFVAGVLIKDNSISNTLILATLVQSFNISRLAYKVFNNKYGHEIYAEQTI